MPSEPNDPDCPQGWDITQKGVTATTNAFILSARRAAWAGLLPAAWPTVLYTNSNPYSYGGTFEGPQELIGGSDVATRHRSSTPTTANTRRCYRGKRSCGTTSAQIPIAPRGPTRT